MNINQELCINCGACQAECPGTEHEDGYRKCVVYENGRYTIDCQHCTGCNACVRICPVGAIAEQTANG